jgi:hypothetical protein
MNSILSIFLILIINIQFYILTLGNWFILQINISPISWIRGRYSSDIDHTLVNSSMLDKISSAYSMAILLYLIINPLIVYCKKITTDESFLLPKKKMCCVGLV